MSKHLKYSFHDRRHIIRLLTVWLTAWLVACAETPATPTPQSYLADGFAALRQEDWQAAQVAFTAGLSQQPDFRPALTGRGQAWLELERWEPAIADFTAALNLDDADAIAWAGRGRAHLKLEIYESAVSDLTHAIQLTPLRSGSYMDRGMAYYRLQEYELAIADFSRAIRANSQAIRPYYWRGMAYHHLKNDAQAVTDLTLVAASGSSLADSAHRHLAQWNTPASAPASPSSSSFAYSFTLADLGEKDIMVRAIFDQVQVHFPLAEGQTIQQARLNLVLAHGKKLLPEHSDLIIALNDEPVAHLPLTAENSGPVVIPLDVPVAALHAGDNLLTFRFNLRLKDTGCSDADSSSLWAKVLAETAVSFNSIDFPLPLDLSRYPAPFDTLSTLDGMPQLTIVLPTSPSPVELTAAAQIAAALGQAAQWPNPPLQAVTAEQLNETDQANHWIVIDTAGNNAMAGSVAPGVTLQPSPYRADRLLLVVSGTDEAGLQQATDLLTTRSAWGILHGNQTIPVAIVTQPPLERPSQVTFIQLGFENAHLHGIGPHDLYYPIDIPYDWKITSDASLELRFRHAPDLASDSTLVAFINGYQVATVPLTNRNDEDGRLVIQLSPRQLRPGRNWLHLHFDLHVRQEDCNFRYLDEAWADISAAESMMNLAHVSSQPPLELRYLPSPLVTPANLSQDVFVLSDRPTPTELTAMLQVAAKLGTYTHADGLRPQATTASAFDPETAVSTHVIAIGQPTTHALLAAYNAELPLPLQVHNQEKTGEWLELLPEAAETNSGYLQLLPAPWSGQRALVVLSAFDDRGLIRAVDIFPSMQTKLSIQGNVAIATEAEVIGLSLRGLAGVSLPQPARLVLSTILIGTFVTMGGLGLWMNYRKKQQTAIVAKNNP